MGLNYFMIEETSSLDFGVIISDAAVFSAPERAYEAINVPGRNGAVLFDEGYYKNITVSYEAAMLNKNTSLDGFRSWLMSFTGYVRLEDTYHPEEYRLAVVNNGLAVSTELANKIGRFTVSFDCKPQRFLKSGEISTRYEASTTIFNPTHYTSKPLIRIYGHGVLGVGNDTVTIASNPLDYVDLDCDICDAYCRATNANSYVSLSGTDYPVFAVGSTGIMLGDNITAVEISPRWWTL